MTSTSTAADNDTNTDEQRSSKKPFGVLGVGAAACAVCCAGPILAFLAAAGVFTAAGVALFGVFGLVVLVPAVAWHLRRRRRATACTAPTAGPVAVELGNRP